MLELAPDIDVAEDPGEARLDLVLHIHLLAHQELILLERALDVTVWGVPRNGVGGV